MIKLTLDGVIVHIYLERRHKSSFMPKVFLELNYMQGVHSCFMIETHCPQQILRLLLYCSSSLKWTLSQVKYR